MKEERLYSFVNKTKMKYIKEITHRSKKLINKTFYSLLIYCNYQYLSF